MAKVLIVDDEPGMRRILAVNLARDSHTVVEADGVESAATFLGREEFDVVLTDQKMGDGTGMDVLKRAQEEDASTAVIFLTAVGTLELAVESMRQGAFDFLTKPFVPEVVRAAIRRAADHTALLRENVLLKTEVKRLEGAEEILGHCAEMEQVRELIARVSATSSTVLITGETGTGKELVARAIHKNSLRSRRPFIAVNCAAFTETLLESELFGHERGAFTGADKARAGLFEAADGGTLFLDEVAETSAAAQAKLLRVLASGELQRLGSTATRRVDVRVLAATHRDLRERMRTGTFREDLYYRLAVVPIHLPPLRNRPSDLPELCQVLCHRIAREMKTQARTISPAGMAKLAGYSFPGNVRELRNLLERALILSPNQEIQADDFLLPQGSGPAEGNPSAAWNLEQTAAQFPSHFDLRDVLANLERCLIERALISANGVQAEAARHLGLSRSDFGYKAAKYALNAPAKLLPNRAEKSTAPSDRDPTQIV